MLVPRALGAVLLRPLQLTLGACLLFAGVYLAQQHPLSPALATMGFAAACGIGLWWPGASLIVLPAALPWMNFAPWTGWPIFEEFDLLVLGIAAGFHLRSMRQADREPAAARPAFPVDAMILLIGTITLVGIWRGLLDASPRPFGGFQGYPDPLNTLRVAKSGVFALLLVPLLQQEIRASAPRAFRRLAAGMLCGLAVVTLAVVVERRAYPGWLDFSSPYRTTALFWEMHVGGAAIDGYLALATPFVAWALHCARSPARWVVAALLALLTGYAALTTFSRGAYLAIGLPALGLGALLWLRQHPAAAWRRKLVAAAVAFGLLMTAAFQAYGFAGTGTVLLALMPVILIRRAWATGWRVAGSRTLALLLALEVVTVLGAGSFMNSRLAASPNDFDNRVEHWRNGVNLLQRPGEWLFGLGWGRLPANYTRFTPHHEFSGAVEWVQTGPDQYAAKLWGPKTRHAIAGSFGLTQRVPLVPGAAYQASFDVRTERPVEIAVSVCEMHLLYERHCQRAMPSVMPDRSGWQRVNLPLSGLALSRGDWFAPREAVFTLSVARPGGVAEIRRVALGVKGDPALLRNPDFADGFAHWFPAAQDYFVPWHIDNLALEILIETGIAGLLAFTAAMGFALWGLLRGPARHDACSPFLAASLFGALLVGTVSSLMDVPRVAFALLLLTFFSVLLAANRPPPHGLPA